MSKNKQRNISKMTTKAKLLVTTFNSFKLNIESNMMKTNGLTVDEVKQQINEKIKILPLINKDKYLIK